MPTTEPGKLKKILYPSLKFILFFGIGILIIRLSLKDLTAREREEILQSFREANYWWVGLTILLGVLSHVIRSLRWIIMLEPMGYKPTLRRTFYAVMIGYFANMAFPRLGEVTRCGILNRYEHIPFNKSFGTVITERFLDIVIFFILFLITVFTQIGTIGEYIEREVFGKATDKLAAASLSFLFIGSVAGILIITAVILWIYRKKIARTKRYRKLYDLIHGFWQGLKSLVKIRRAWLFILYSLLIWLLYFLMVYLCFFSLPETSNLGLSAGLVVLVLGTVGIMITPGGIGLYPAIVQKTLFLYSISQTTGLAMGWITWSGQTIMIILAGCISLILLSFARRRMKHEKI